MANAYEQSKLVSLDHGLRVYRPSACEESGDKSVPSAQAVAVLGERIVAVGSSAEVDEWRGARTLVIDAGG